MDEASAKALLVAKVVAVAKERAAFFTRAFIPQPHDDDETLKAKKSFLLVRLREWAADPILFIRENAWVPDPRNLFGSDSMPEGVSPKGMVPLLAVAKLEEVVREIDRLFESGDEWDFVADKPRQFALTTAICWWLVHKFLFRKGFTAVVGSGKGPDEIDAGGKGKRDATSLFGRMRLFLDAFMWNLSTPNADGTRTSLVKFNQHAAPVPGRYNKAAVREWRKNLTGMGDSDDTSNRLARPRWTVHGVEMFSGAEGNWILGNVPGDGFARSQTCSCAFIDEFPHCNSELGPDTDRLSWAACAVNTRFRMAIGTWPRGGSSSTEMYRIMRLKPPTAKIVHLHWTDLPVYLFGAEWECGACGCANPWPHTESTGHDGVERTCSSCEEPQTVTRFMVSSPWLVTAKAKLSNDPVSIASEIMNDPESTNEDRFFIAFNAKEALVRRKHLGPVNMVDGFDPGHSTVYPAAFVAVAYQPALARPRIVGYWMASATHIEWWTPFFKRWHPRMLQIVHTKWGAKAGRPWLKAFHYPPEALAMMEHLSSFPPGEIYGDTSGSKRMMVESPYEVLECWNLHVNHRYTADREALVRTGSDWAGRMEIDPVIADLKPPAVSTGGWLPSVLSVFQSARSVAVSQSGKIDVDAKVPPFVKNACDAWFYACRAFGSLADVMVERVGTEEFAVREHEAKVEVWGEGSG